jgi:hypothetical protein
MNVVFPSGGDIVPTGTGITASDFSSTIIPLAMPKNKN